MAGHSVPPAQCLPALSTVEDAQEWPEKPKQGVVTGQAVPCGAAGALRGPKGSLQCQGS